MSTKTQTTLVIGGSGKTGRRVANRLIAAGHPVRAAARSGETRFDWQDQATWAPALSGVEAAYITYYPDLALPGAADTVGAFADLAVANGVRRLVLLSGRGEESARQAELLVETSGAVDVSPLDPRAHKIMDLKCPGSGEVERNHWLNLSCLSGRDEVKFVVLDRTDYEWMRSVVSGRGLDEMVRRGGLNAIIVSPVWGEIDVEVLAGWILEDRLPVRMQIQLHKQIWGPEKTGV